MLQVFNSIFKLFLHLMVHTINFKPFRSIIDRTFTIMFCCICTA